MNKTKNLQIIYIILFVITAAMAQKEEKLAIQASQLLDEEKYDQAISKATEAIRYNPNYDLSYRVRGLAYSLKMNLNLAIKDFTKAIELNKNIPLNYYCRGAAYFYTQKFQEAVKDLSQALDIKSSDEDFPKNIYYLRGISLIKIGNYDLAIKDLTKHLFVNSSDSLQTYIWRAFAYKEAQNFQSSISDYSKVIQLDPNNDDAYFQRALVYEIKGDYVLALKDCNMALGINPKSEKALNLRGILYCAQKDYENGLVDFRNVYNLNNFAGFQENIGWALYGLGSYDKAIETCKAALKAKSDLTWAKLILALSYETKGNLSQSLKYYELYLESEPNQDFNKRYLNIDIESIILKYKNEFPALDQKKIAILKLKTEGISDNITLELTDRLQYELFCLGKMKIMDRKEIDSILLKHGFKQLGDITTTNLVEIGKLLNVQHIISGSVSKVDSFYSIQLHCNKVNTGELLKIVKEEVKGDLGTLFNTGIENAASKLAEIY